MKRNILGLNKLHLLCDTKLGYHSIIRLRASNTDAQCKDDRVCARSENKGSIKLTT